MTDTVKTVLTVLLSITTLVNYSSEVKIGIENGRCSHEVSGGHFSGHRHVKRSFTPPGNTYGSVVTTSVVIEELDKEYTREFLSRFESDIQRYIVKTQLLNCPYTALCNFAFNFNLPHIIDSCCADCSCNYPNCFVNRTCCPDILPPELFQLSTNYRYDNGTLVGNKPLHSDQAYYGEHGIYGEPPNASVDAYQYPLESESENHVFEVKIQRLMECTLMTPIRNPVKPVVSFNTYRNCPEGTDTQLKTKCEQDYTTSTVRTIIDIIPVLSVLTNDLYRNKHCAICNGISVDTLTYFQVILGCDTEETFKFIRSDEKILDYVLNRRVCVITFLPQNSQDTSNKHCKPNVNTCNWMEFDPVVDRACQLYSSLFTQNEGVYYQNPFCAICNNVQRTTYGCIHIPISTSAMPFAFSGLLRVGNYEEVGTDNTLQTELQGCDDVQQVYDPLTNTCIVTSCSELHDAVHGECIPILSIALSFSYTVYIRLYPVGEVKLSSIFNRTTDIIDALQVYFKDDRARDTFYICQYRAIYVLHEKLDLIEHIQEHLLLKTLPVYYIELELNMTLRDKHSPFEFVETIKYSHRGNLVLIIPDNEIVFTVEPRSNDAYIFKSIFSNLQSNVLNRLWEYYKNNLAHQFQNLTHPVFNNHIFLPYNIHDTRSPRCKKGIKFFPAAKVVDCRMVQVNKSTFHWEEKLNGIFFPELNIILKPYEYYYSQYDEVHMCADRYITAANKTVLSRLNLPGKQVKKAAELSIEIIISVTFICLSLLCLVITLIIYTAIPTLQTLPGLNTMALCTSLLAAQSMYLISNFGGFEQNSPSCVVVGMLLHFLWLLALFWMNGCTYHMYRVLTITEVRTFNTRSTHLKFQAYPLVLSLLLVIANVVTSLVMSQGSDVGYGRTVCYFSSENMLQYTFAVPTFLVVIANLVMFVVAVGKIRRIGKIRKSVKNDRNDLIIFTKLSTITGIAWLSGFLYSWTHIKVFSYIFIGLNATQGVFIMFSFAVNRRILNSYKQWVSSRTSRLSIGTSR